MHSPEDKARSVFQDALELPATEREAFVRAACGPDQALRTQVNALLEAYEAAADFLSDTRPRATEAAGTVIDRYKLIEQVGEGGFGVVWKAQQSEPVRRVVALKIIKLGMDTRQVVARFEAERQALAMMEHPNIAKVLDGGATAAGRPYFVMEFVKGVPITDYCDHVGMDTAARLTLFQSVCLAVQHAHQKGVIHRDLKPGNILVAEQDGEPVVKVIDFGIAKATDHELTQQTLHTGLRQMIGTPDYMAPEQTMISRLDIDTRADVYSLGIVLYELLTGTKPFVLTEARENGLDEVLRRIREDEPPRPSSRIGSLGERLPRVAAQRRLEPARFARTIRGDLDWIVLRAIAKDRNRRYSTAIALSEDIGRHLADLPVVAGPPGTLYRLRKFIQRNGPSVMAAAAVLLALLAGGIGVLLALDRALDAEGDARSQATRADEAAAAARKESHLMREMLALTQEMLSSASPHTNRGPDYTLRQLLDDFSSRLQRQLVDSPLIEAALRTTVGNAYRSLGLLDEAEVHLQAALRASETAHAESPSELAAIRSDWAHLLHDRGRYEAALAASHDARELAAGDAVAVLAAQAFEVDLLRHLGKHEDAEQLARSAIEQARSLGAEGRRVLPNLLTNLAMVQKERQQLPAAAELLEQAEQLLTELPGASESALAGQLLYRGTVLHELGRDDVARDCASRALAILRERLGAEHPQTISCLHLLGLAVAADGDHTAAADTLRQAVQAFTATVGPDHPQTAGCRLSLARSLLVLGRYDEAIEELEAAHRGYRLHHGPDSPYTANAANSLGLQLLKSGRTRAARRLFAEARHAYELQFGSDHRYVALVRINVATSYCRDREFPVAVAELGDVEALSAYAEFGAWFRASVELLRGHAFAADRRADEALAATAAARELMQDEAASPEQQARLSIGHAEALRAAGRAGEALPELEAAAGAARAQFPEPATRWNAELELGRVLSALGRFEAAEQRMQAALEALRDVRDNDDWTRRCLHALVEMYTAWSATDASVSAKLEAHRQQLADHDAAVERAQEPG
ncbi:MAG TPA: tetratricopeptide repeat protein [Planctomycetota bacterium]|nr:tetratricopeptide repeat protein [Planctomycetota bacterium]